VLLRARTGSGKTGAFAIPVIQRILNSKQVSKPKMTSFKLVERYIFNKSTLPVEQVLCIIGI
jgi:superfamily II DNA/RNA helicase